MDDFVVEAQPFAKNDANGVQHFHAVSKKRGHLPVVLKYCQIRPLDISHFREAVQTHVEEGLVQGLVKHPNICRVLESKFELDYTNRQGIVVHVLEALEKDLGGEIIERTASNRLVSEEELVKFLLQTSGALAQAHSLGNYKVADFDTYFEKKATVRPANSEKDANPYSSPQQRLANSASNRKVAYDPFKSDVYALALTALVYGSLLSPPSGLWKTEAIDRTLEALQCCRSLRHLLRDMLIPDDGTRISMEFVHSRLNSIQDNPNERQKIPSPNRLPPPKSALNPPLQPLPSNPPTPSVLAFVAGRVLHFFDSETKAWTNALVNPGINPIGPVRCLWVGTDLLCSEGTEVYLVQRAEVWEALKLPYLQTYRMGHGLWWFESDLTVFAFGGDDKTCGLKTCEQLKIDSENLQHGYEEMEGWRYVENQMEEGRAYFNPCEFRGKVYLCGRFSSLIEAFHPCTLSFLTLDFRFPEHTYPCCSFLHRHQLVILSRHYLVQIDTHSDGELALLASRQHPQLSVMCNMAPVVTKEGTVYFSNRKELCAVNIDESGELEVVS